MSENQKKIWITGASSGIGKALALKFAKENWQVAISARRKELLNEIAQNENIFSFPLDVIDDDTVKAAFSNILIKFKDVDLSGITQNQFNRYSGFTFGNGAIASILMYDRNLTSAESIQNYNAQKNRFI
jgi:NAD(P)-dependent dehydrogenase (short-subunit alcohol dehydrogenase family)